MKNAAWNGRTDLVDLKYSLPSLEDKQLVKDDRIVRQTADAWTCLALIVVILLLIW